jgi:enoyl-[acyl-carrier protein] reductase II
MLKTPLCDLLGIDVPVISAPFGTWHEVDLAAQAQDALTRARNTATARR